MKVKCIAMLFGYGDLMTIGKEYEVDEVENGEYWIEDDQGECNPFPHECYKLII